MWRQMEHQGVDTQIKWWLDESQRLIQLAVQTHNIDSLQDAWRYSRAAHELTRAPTDQQNPELTVWQDMAHECIRMALQMDVDKYEAFEVALAYFRAIHAYQDNPEVRVLDQKIRERTQQLFAEKYEASLYEALELCYFLETNDQAAATLFQIHNCIFWYLGRWARCDEIEYIQCMVAERIEAENNPSIIHLEDKRKKRVQEQVTRELSTEGGKIISISQERSKRQAQVS
jgi:hypothetical protein